jgi:solute carrier family 25 oxoglutarate transporter 11
MLPAAERRNYKNAFDALVRIGREEGAKTLWRGSVTNMVRAVAMNVGMLATYDEAKERIMHYNGRTKESLTDRLLASCIAGFSCAFLSLPFDNCKTKL